RRAAVADLPRRHVPDPEADLPDPDEPLDHLGLRRLHPAVPPDQPGPATHGQLPDGDVPVPGGVREERLRPRGGDLDPHDPDRRAPERVLRAPDGADGADGMSAVAPATARSRRPAAARRARRRRAGRTGWNLLGLVVLVVMLFPVYWMVTTAFKKD